MSEWEWYRDTNVMALFIHILFLANWEDKKWQGKIIKRGSFITSIDHLSLESGLTMQQTRTVLDKLINTGEINKQTTNKYTLITINKYNDYQDNNKQITNEQQTNNKQITTTKEYKNNKEYKEIKKSKYYDLSLLTNDNFQDIANKYLVPINFVKSKYDDLINWHEKNPQKNYYKNYLSALRDWVKRDSLKIKQEYGKQASEVSI